MSLDFKHAIKSIKSQELGGNNQVPDLLSFQHLGLKQFTETIIEDVNFLIEESKAEALLKIDVPKANFTIRPMSRPILRDWMLYEAIVNYLAPKILRGGQVCPNSYSILKFKGNTRRKIEPWLKFDLRCRELFKSGYRYVVTTDITSFFENINLNELRNRMLNFAKSKDEEEVINLLFNKLLKEWSKERIEGFGLPQGPNASLFLGDLFLDYLDRKMEGYTGYVRYMDDIRIFCKREIDAKITLKELTIALRDLKLNINAKKTRILSGKGAERQIFDPKKPQIDAVEKAISSGEKNKIEAIVPILIDIFTGAFSENNEFEKTHLGFSLRRLVALKASGYDFSEDEVVQTILNHLGQKPHHSGLFCNFLSLFSKSEKVINFLLSFLRKRSNIYEWQELQVLRALLRLKFKAKRRDINLFLQRGRDRNRHFATRSLYLLLAGKHGSNRDRELVLDLFDNGDSEQVKEAIVLATQELGRGSRNRFYSRIKSPNTLFFNNFVAYVKAYRTPIYYLEPPRLKIEAFERPIYE